MQASSFNLPSGVDFSYGVAPIKTWVHVHADVPCSTMGSYCVDGNANACVSYPQFQKCTLDEDRALMPEFLPWAKVAFTST